MMAFVFLITDLSCQTWTLWFDRAQGGTVPNVSAVCDKLAYASSDNYRVPIAKYLNYGACMFDENAAARASLHI
jgi:hypothetical protein